MSAATFRAHCARGHERIDFEGAAGAMLFEAHMKAEHKRYMLKPGASIFGPAPGWSNGRIDKPYPWKAPAVPKDWQVKLAAILEEASTEHQLWPVSREDFTPGRGGHYTSHTPAFEGWEVAS